MGIVTLLLAEATRVPVHDDEPAPPSLAPARARRSAQRLLGRRVERAALDALVRSVAAGESQALVIRGNPGVGKSRLLTYVAERAQGYRIVHAVGVESEMELAFAGLQQLCAPLLGRLE